MSNESIAIVIPARAASRRLPNKPLAVISGVPMLRRVIDIASMVRPRCRVIVATESDAIRAEVDKWGVAECVLTPATCRTGSDRVAVALNAVGIHDGIVVNFQGDAPVTPPWVLEGLINRMKGDPKVICATPAVELSRDDVARLEEHKVTNASSGTTVVTNLSGEALYFSKTILPFARATAREVPVLRHIGMYAFRVPFLRIFLSLPETPLERSEKLEQLRILEHGYKIHVVKVDYRGRTHASVDAPADIAEVERIIATEGELAAGMSP